MLTSSAAEQVPVLQGADIDLASPLVPEAHHSQRREEKLYFFYTWSHKKSINKLIADFYFCTLGSRFLCYFIHFTFYVYFTLTYSWHRDKFIVLQIILIIQLKHKIWFFSTWAPTGLIVQSLLDSPYIADWLPQSGWWVDLLHMWISDSSIFHDTDSLFEQFLSNIEFQIETDCSFFTLKMNVSNEWPVFWPLSEVPRLSGIFPSEATAGLTNNENRAERKDATIYNIASFPLETPLHSRGIFRKRNKKVKKRRKRQKKNRLDWNASI